MNLQRLAADLLGRGESRLADADRALRERRWPDVLRFAQEATELALKALLRAMAVEVPKRHDVGPALESVASSLPTRVGRELPAILRLSAELADRRAIAMYGDELGGRTASEVFRSAEEAQHYLHGARHVVTIVRAELARSGRRRSDHRSAKRR